MNKNTMTKWLLKKNVDGTLEIEPKEVNAHAPINRVLDCTGFFEFSLVKATDKKFLIVYKK